MARDKRDIRKIQLARKIVQLANQLGWKKGRQLTDLELCEVLEVSRSPMHLPSGPNERWSLDFVSDAFDYGWRFCILCIVDDFTRECLGLVRTRRSPAPRKGNVLEPDSLFEWREVGAQVTLAT